MIILGIDPGLQRTGYGIVNSVGNFITFIDAGYIKTLATADLEVRLDKIHSELKCLIDKHKPAVLVLEKLYSHYRHPTTASLLGHARGVICLLAAQENIKLLEYGATRIKKAVVGRGHASKNQIQRMVQNLLNLKEVHVCEDVTDALALAIAHTYISRIKI